MICDKLAVLQSQHLLRTFVWILGTVNIKGQYAQKDQAENCLNAIKKALGPLPLLLQTKQAPTESAEEAKQVIKTVVLADGTYGQQVVHVQERPADGTAFK